MARSVLVGLLLALVTVSPGIAETFQVTTTADDDGPCLPDDCSLREALIAANNLPGRDTVLVPAGTYAVEIPGLSGTAGSFDIRDDLDLFAEPGTIFQGDGQDRVLAVARPFFGAPPVYAVIRSVIFQGGRGDGNGGGVRVTGSDLTLVDCVVRNNYATYGGGVGASVAGLHLIRTSVIDNEAALDGGGVFRIGVTNSPTPSVLEIVNSTIARNHAFQGGGIGMRNDTLSFILRNSTVADNTAEFRAAAVSIIRPNLRDGTFVFANNILDASSSINTGSCSLGLVPDSLGGNIEIPRDTCFLPHATDRMNVPDSGLGPLTYDLGPTPVMPLLADSPAIDAGVDAECEAEDQRGVARPRDGDGDGTPRCDAGAVELGASPAVIPVAGWPGLLAFAAALAAASWWALRRRKASYRVLRF